MDVLTPASDLLVSPQQPVPRLGGLLDQIIFSWHWHWGSVNIRLRGAADPIEHHRGHEGAKLGILHGLIHRPLQEVARLVKDLVVGKSARSRSCAVRSFGADSDLATTRVDSGGYDYHDAPGYLLKGRAVDAGGAVGIAAP
jgi:hypothetical protein